LKALIEHDVAKPYDGSLAEAAKHVKAKCTIMVERQDHLCNPAPATEFSKLLNAKLVVLESDLGHVGVADFDDPQIKQGIQDELAGAD
jgi:homoserine acetyltransferase